MSSRAAPSRSLPGRAAHALTGIAAAVAVAVALLVLLAGGPATARWQVVPTPDAGVRQGVLSAAACASTHSCMAVGSFTSSGGRSLAESFDGRAWSIVPTPGSPAGGSTALRGVSCPAAGVCVAVGYSVTPAGEARTLVEVWNGTSWSVQESPNPAATTGSSLNSVSCSSPTACTAVGQYYPSPSTTRTLAERLEDGRWTIQPTADPPGSGSLRAVSCASANDCTAVGNYIDARGVSRMVAETWSGSRWAIQLTPPVANATLVGVSCPDPGSCLAVGQYRNDDLGENLALAVHYAGTRWTVQDPPAVSGAINSFLFGAACPAPADCAAVGDYIDSHGVQRPLTASWDGAGWRVQPAPSPSGQRDGSLTGMACPTVRSCVAVGSGLDGGGDYETAAERWDGSGWQVVGSPNPFTASSDGLTGVSCATPRTCAAVGDGTDVTSSEHPLVQHWDGSRWTSARVPLPPTATSAFLAHVSCQADRCVGVGDYRDAPGRDRPLVDAGGSAGLQVEPAPAPPGATASSLSGVSCVATGPCTAVGSSRPPVGHASPLVERSQSGSWTIEPTPALPGAISGFLSAVSCASASACTAVGAYENAAGDYRTLAERWSGATWTVQTTPDPPGARLSVLADVSCPTALDCTAVGWTSAEAGGPRTLAERWDGRRWMLEWTPSAAGRPSELAGVSCRSALACTAVGSALGFGAPTALIESWSGRGWQTSAGAGVPAVTLEGVSCRAGLPCVAVGDRLDGRVHANLAEQRGTP